MPLISHAQGHLPEGCGVSAPHTATLQTEYLRKTVLRPEGTPRGAQQGTACHLGGSVSGHRWSEKYRWYFPCNSGFEANATHQSSPLAPSPFLQSPPSPDTRLPISVVARQEEKTHNHPSGPGHVPLRGLFRCPHPPPSLPDHRMRSPRRVSFPPYIKLNTIITTFPVIIYLFYLTSYHTLCYLRSSIVIRL